MPNGPQWIRGLPTRFTGGISLILLLCLKLFAQESASNEYQVKAAYLFNFVKFVEWPSNIFPNPDSPVEICVLGTNPFGHALEDSITGKTVNGRTMKVIHLPREIGLEACQIIFISSSEKGQMREILQQLSGQSVLTVGDMSGFTENGGVINFVLDGDRVRFDANVEAAKHAHLKLSARLLTVAKAIVGNSSVEHR